MTVDSHLHILDPTHLRYPWIESDPELNRCFRAAEYERGTSAVNSIVFVQAGCLDEQGLDEVRWVDEVASVRELPIDAIVAFAPIDDPEKRKDALDALAAYPRVVGVRRLLQGKPLSFLTDADSAERLINGLAELSSRRLSFDAGVTWHQLGAIVDLLRRLPDLAVVLDHLGKPPIASGWHSEDVRTWAAGISRLARLPEVTVKLSGLGSETPSDLPLESVAPPYIDTALNAFGPGRCMVGSDWPVSTKSAGERAYDRWFDLVLDSSGLDPVERFHVAEGTARNFYHLPAPGEIRLGVLPY